MLLALLEWQFTMQQIKLELNATNRELIKVDNFLYRFLEQFEMKMDYEDTSSPYWKLYKDKLNERSQLSQKVKSLEYRLKRI